MRRATLMVMSACFSGLFLFMLVGLAFAWLGEANTLVLPDAADIRMEHLSLTRQHITYRLPPNQTPDALFTQLVQAGWARDTRGELGRLRDQSDADTFVVFWRQNWLGLVSELIAVGRTAPEQHAVDIQLSRCFVLARWMRCP